MSKLKLKLKRKSGRKPVAGVIRSASGRIAKAHRKPVETQEQILAVAIAQPHRRGFSDPKNPFLGYSVGRLFAAGQISQIQHDAAEWYGKLWLSYHRHITGITPPRVSAHLSEFVAASNFRLPHGNDNENWHAIDLLRARMDGLQEAFAERGQHFTANKLLPAVCVFDIPPAACDVVALRETLNTVWRFMQRGLTTARA
ncbi:hypothetical protein ACFFJB_14745 [Camelimonas abortus]|uniref:Uncharacterized protein n=1 Tax=Camelimonas abortus TaxID=1017184 RepID=A0ABV7LH95_9HYPH